MKLWEFSLTLCKENFEKKGFFLETSEIFLTFGKENFENNGFLHETLGIFLNSV